MLSSVKCLSTEFVRLVLENKMIDINKKDHEGVNAFWIACICGNGGVMRLLAERGIDIHNTDKQGNNALHVAAKHPKLNKCLKMLIDSGFPLEDVNHDRDTALHIAAQRGNIENVKLLCEGYQNGSEQYRAEINVRNKAKMSPLYLAILNTPD